MDIQAARERAATDYPIPFVLQRDEDETGISGTGVVAGGVLFPDGVVALRWYSEWPTSVVFHDRGMDAVEAIHGHSGKTRIIRADPSDLPAALEALEEAQGKIDALRFEHVKPSNTHRWPCKVCAILGEGK